jgi:Holliday junction resolvasome RuvABC endonuclease subunit
LNILGLDASLRSSGWAVLGFESGSLVDMGRIVTSGSDGLPVERYLFAQRAFREILDEYDISHVSAEAVVFGKGDEYSQVPSLYAMYIVLQTEMLSRGVRAVYFWPSQWYAMHYRTDEFKKLESKKLTEDERQRIELNRLKFQLKDKADTKQYVAEVLGIPANKISSDEADAYVIAYYGRRFFLYLRGDLPESQLDVKEREVFIKRKTIRKHKGLVLDPPMELCQGTVSKENKAWFDFSLVEEPPSKFLKVNKALRRKE